MTDTPERATSTTPKRAADMGQEDLSKEELASIIAERQAELQQLMERAASGKAPEEKSKCHNHIKPIYDSIPCRGQALASRW